jgi:glutathione S-transferase
VRIALGLKGIDYTNAFTACAKGAARARLSGDQSARAGARAGHRRGGVDASLAIIDYLDETRPAPAFLPADPRRTLACAAAQAIAIDIHPIQNLKVLRWVRRSWGATRTPGPPV